MQFWIGGGMSFQHLVASYLKLPRKAVILWWGTDSGFVTAYNRGCAIEASHKSSFNGVLRFVMAPNFYLNFILPYRDIAAKKKTVKFQRDTAPCQTDKRTAESQYKETLRII